MLRQPHIIGPTAGVLIAGGTAGIFTHPGFIIHRNILPVPVPTDCHHIFLFGNEAADFIAFVKLAYLSPALRHSGGTVCEPVDLPVATRHLDMVHAHMRYSDKPFMGSVTAPERAADSVEMCRILFGADFVERNCVMVSLINVNSPLVYDATMLGALKVYARAGQACVVSPFILSGAIRKYWDCGKTRARMSAGSGCASRPACCGG